MCGWAGGWSVWWVMVSPVSSMGFTRCSRPHACAIALIMSLLTTSSSAFRSRRPLRSMSEVAACCWLVSHARWHRCCPLLGRSVIMAAVHAMPATFAFGCASDLALSRAFAAIFRACSSEVRRGWVCPTNWSRAFSAYGTRASRRVLDAPGCSVSHAMALAPAPVVTRHMEAGVWCMSLTSCGISSMAWVVGLWAAGCGAVVVPFGW